MALRRHPNFSRVVPDCSRRDRLKSISSANAAYAEGFCARPIWAKPSTIGSWWATQMSGCRKPGTCRDPPWATTADWDLPARTGIRPIDRPLNVASGAPAADSDVPKPPFRCEMADLGAGPGRTVARRPCRPFGSLSTRASQTRDEFVAGIHGASPGWALDRHPSLWFPRRPPAASAFAGSASNTASSK